MNRNEHINFCNATGLEDASPYINWVAKKIFFPGKKIIYIANGGVKSPLSFSFIFNFTQDNDSSTELMKNS